MSMAMIISYFFTNLILIVSTIDPPSDCRFLNPVHDLSAETALLDFFNTSEPFIFKETNFFQPQCLLCEKLGGQVCFGYKGATSHGITSGTINVTRLVTNLPYIYSLGENVGALYTTVYTIAVLREDLVIPYRTLLRFKGITTLDPIVAPKSIVLRVCMICLGNDTNEYFLTFTGPVYGLTVRLFINEITVNASNGILLDGNVKTKINCKNQTVTIQSQSNIPDDVPCSNVPCLGSEFCLTYQPEYTTTRETWCPLTENNWLAIPNNSIRLLPSDSALPFHIQIERNLLYENPFSLILNPDWFISYPGILTVSVPEATRGIYPDPIWKIVLPSTGRFPLNQRIILLYNCTDVRIRYNVSDSVFFQTTIIFVDMKSNSTFTVKDNLEEAKQICNPEILVAIDDNSSTTNQPQTQTTTSTNGNFDSSTSWKPTNFGQMIQSCSAMIIVFYMLLSSFHLL